MKRISLWGFAIIFLLLITKLLDLSISAVAPHASTLVEEFSSTTQSVSSNITSTTTAPTNAYLHVVKVVDGDTIDVREVNAVVRVRLIGVNTPETVDPRRPAECFGHEASERTKSLLSSGLVRLEGDPTQGELDKYGRRLAYVYTDSGVMVNHELIAEGYGYEYTYHTAYRHQAEFKNAERNARALVKGLWAVCPPKK